MGFWDGWGKSYSIINAGRRGATRKHGSRSDMHGDAMGMGEGDEVIVVYTETPHGTAVDIEWMESYQSRHTGFPWPHKWR